MRNKLIVALDVSSIKKAKLLVDKLYPYVKIFKVGNELFTACGPEAIKMIRKKGAKVFLDLKFHDIPNTVARAVTVARRLGVFMLNVHVSGSSSMMKAASRAKGKRRYPILLGVTVLTSLDKKELKAVGINNSSQKQVQRLGRLAKASGLDGIICSAKEISAVHKVCGDKFIIVTPGIRPAKSARADQKRIATPEYAIKKGVDYIVVGRPITESKDPLSSAKAIGDVSRACGARNQSG